MTRPKSRPGIYTEQATEVPQEGIPVQVLQTIGAVTPGGERNPVSVALEIVGEYVDRHGWDDGASFRFTHPEVGVQVEISPRV